MSQVLNRSLKTVSLSIHGKEHQAPEWVETKAGVFNFDRVAFMHEGCVDLEQLRLDECLLAPGLIYRLERIEK